MEAGERERWGKSPWEFFPVVGNLLFHTNWCTFAHHSVASSRGSNITECYSNHNGRLRFENTSQQLPRSSIHQDQ